jgi:hypothetical protein
MEEHFCRECEIITTFTLEGYCRKCGNHYDNVVRKYLEKEADDRIKEEKEDWIRTEKFFKNNY